MNSINSSVSRLACLMIVTAAAPAMAYDPIFANEGVLHEKVRYSDLNLASAKGVEVLYHRIKSASEHVCGDYHDANIALSMWAATLACKRVAMQAAVVKIGNTALTKYYEDQLGANHAPLTASAAAVPKVAVSLE